MRETCLAFAPLAAVLYFLCFPGQFAQAMFWASNLLR
jgi:hypothetical protein